MKTYLIVSQLDEPHWDMLGSDTLIRPPRGVRPTFNYSTETN